MAESKMLTPKRIQELDIFRGFAILGIFMVNILVMNVSFAYRGEWEAEQTGWIQKISFFILETFFYSKFFVLFSFLFGTGVALQIERAKEKSTFQLSFFFRRFGSLFLFGIMHILFIWSGDILHLYGMLGFLLLLFFRLSPKALLWSTILIFLFPLFPALFESFVNWIGLDYDSYLPELTREEILNLKHNGSYYSGIKLRIKEYLFAMGLIYSGIAPIALTMMLLGGYIVKTEWIYKIGKLLEIVKPYLLISALILVVYRFTLLYYIVPNFSVEHGSATSIILMTFFQLSEVSISLTLLWILGYLWNIKKFHNLLEQLSFVGRMAFSNYILQSVIGYLIMRTFNGYEFFTPLSCIILVLAVFGFQIIISRWWLSKYRFGPLEWLWRCISYWKILSFRKA